MGLTKQGVIDMAKDMLSSDDTIESGLMEVLMRAYDLCMYAGGTLVSRQVIAGIIANYEYSQSRIDSVENQLNEFQYGRSD